VTNNPFGSPSRTPSPQNPRGPEFTIKSGTKTFRGRAINREYLTHILRRKDEASARGFAQLIVDELYPIESRLARLEAAVLGDDD
jgi:hypothetical protein